VVQYRSFRNTDPPSLVGVWNSALTGRGAVRLQHSSTLEDCVFAKPCFDPAGLILAEEDGQCVGFVHAGFGPDAAGDGLDPTTGVTCMLCVKPTHRRRGIGSELLRRSEEYLRVRGVRTLCAGPGRDVCAYYMGLYGGSDLPGVLDSDPEARLFLQKRGYGVHVTTLVWQRSMDRQVKVLDPRCAAHMRRYDIDIDQSGACSTWWQNCVLGLIEPLQFILRDRQQKTIAATALGYELEGFSWRWGRPSAGILFLQVAPELRKQGLAKFFLAQVLRYYQDQCFELVEVQAGEQDEPAGRLLRGLGFAQVDVGRVFRKGE
jgi:ribosomal protein S18 acetylase RimI-like enzyme